jgi:hypothetical protein
MSSPVGGKATGPLQPHRLLLNVSLQKAPMEEGVTGVTLQFHILEMLSLNFSRVAGYTRSSHAFPETSMHTSMPR